MRPIGLFRSYMVDVKTHEIRPFNLKSSQKQVEEELIWFNIIQQHLLTKYYRTQLAPESNLKLISSKKPSIQ